FLRAEDGIRDFHVTGVQTCALPIFKLPVNEDIIEPIVRDAKRTSLEIYYLKKFPTRNLTFMCSRWCDFYQLCTAELRGLDTSFIREREYRPREERGED